MNRGDYETLAAAIADSDADDHARRILAFDLADALTGTNQRFDPVRWLRQCGIPVKPGEVAQWTSRLAYRVEHIHHRRQACEQRTGVRLESYSTTVPALKPPMPSVVGQKTSFCDENALPDPRPQGSRLHSSLPPGSRPCSQETPFRPRLDTLN
ncbi:hypothetical protein [Streptomyces mirabilis]|uniref:hypothetical protein n=1 Tax=Streptomyces mirabilis TaxID=68239 RepID=UPI0036D13010